MTGPRRGLGPDREAQEGRTRSPELVRRFLGYLHSSGLVAGASRAVVGVSGGIDSMTLLHLLARHREAVGLRIHAVHVDHRLRPASPTDARWVAARCEDLGVPCLVYAAPEPVKDEAAGRTLRYGHFERVRRQLGNRAVTITGHTADDQAETVLFRMARGSGPRGLMGIRQARSDAVVRPLLPFWRTEIESFAQACRIPFREDPSNRDENIARNRIRHRILPELERAVPGARASLASLAATSESEYAALNELLDDRLRGMAHPRHRGADAAERTMTLDGQALGELSDPLCVALLRRAVARMGGQLGRSATADLLRFVRGAGSGHQLTVRGGLQVTHDLGAVVIRRAAAAAGGIGGHSPPQRPLRIKATPGDGVVETAGGPVQVCWGPPPGRGLPLIADIRTDTVAFPLGVRPWRPGDRLRLEYGSKKVKKILLEARISSDRRSEVLVVHAATGEVIWVPGVTLPSPRARAVGGTPLCRVEVLYQQGFPCMATEPPS